MQRIFSNLRRYNRNKNYLNHRYELGKHITMLKPSTYEWSIIVEFKFNITSSEQSDIFW